MRTWRWYSKVVLALVLLAFAYSVWPTPWYYMEGGWQRVNRLTGSLQSFDPQGGWQPESTAAGPQPSPDTVDWSTQAGWIEGLGRLGPIRFAYAARSAGIGVSDTQLAGFMADCGVSEGKRNQALGWHWEPPADGRAANMWDEFFRHRGGG